MCMYLPRFGKLAQVRRGGSVIVRFLYSCLLGIILWTGDNSFDIDCHSTVKESREKLIFIEHMLHARHCVRCLMWLISLTHSNNP